MNKKCTGIAVLACLALLVGCGEKGTPLTPEQQKVVTQWEDSLKSLQAKAQPAIDALQDKAASSPDVKKAQDDLKTALASAQDALKSLQTGDSTTFDKKKAEVEAALKDVQDKITAAVKAAGTGGLKIPGM